MSSHFVYSVSEFRAKMRGAFGIAEAGGKVFIDRYGETFELVHRPNLDPSVPFDEVTELSEKELKALTGIKIPSNVTVHSTPPVRPDVHYSVGTDTGSPDGDSTVIVKHTPDGKMEVVHSEYIPPKKNSLAKAKQEVANLQAQQAIEQKRMKMDGLKFCKAGHILSSNGKCLQKGCKWA